MTLNTQDLKALVRTIYDAYNERNFDKATAVVSEQFELLEIPSNTSYRGRAGLKQVLNRWATAFPDSKVEILRIVPSADHSVVEFLARGVHRGVLETPQGPIAPTNQKLEMRFCDVIDHRDGKIVAIRTYYDVAGMLKQLGLFKPERLAA